MLAACAASRAANQPTMTVEQLAGPVTKSPTGDSTLYAHFSRSRRGSARRFAVWGSRRRLYGNGLMSVSGVTN